MSLHIKPTEEAANKLRSQKKRRFLTASLTAVLCTCLLAILLYIAVIFIPDVLPPKITLVPPTSEPDATTTHEVDPQQKSPIQKPSLFPEITTEPPITSHNSSFLPTTPGNSEGTDFTPSVDTDPGTSLFPSANQQNPWGDDKRPASGSVLTGTFYDFKQTKRNAPTNMTPEEAAKIMQGFVTKKWKANDFSKYYESSTKLYNSIFYIPRCKATDAPKAYKCEDKVKDSRWCAIYRGNVVAPKSGKFRFVGAGDDNITVRFNNENVFDYGFYMLSYPNRTVPMNQDIRDVMSGKKKDAAIEKQLKETEVYSRLPVDFYQYSSMPHWNKSINGLASGKIFEVKAGETYPIEILVTEIPGGEFGAVLLIQDMDVKTYKKDPKTGSPILPLFRTNDIILEADALKGIGGDIIPFAPIGPIWQVKE